jgi:hypothetical protein
MRISLYISPDGTCRSVYSDTVRKLMPGPIEVDRVSSVEFDHDFQQWKAVDELGEIIATDPDRDACLAKEREVIEQSLRMLVANDPPIGSLPTVK